MSMAAGPGARKRKSHNYFCATVAKIALTVADQQRQLQRGYGEATDIFMNSPQYRVQWMRDFDLQS
jgi:hypothetical protein